jgi:hypothetical protein
MIIFTLAVIGLLVCFFKIEIYFIRKSRESFRELKQAYREMKDAEQDLHNLLKDKDL